MSGLLLFYVLPFIISLYYSLIENVFSKKFVGLSNYIQLFKNEFFLLALKNTFMFTITSVPVLMASSLLLSFLFVHFINKFELIRMSLIFPLLLPSASIVLVWQILFGENSYLVTQLLGIKVIDNSEFFKIPVTLFFIWKNLGYNIILLTAGLMQIPQEQYEASDLDGANIVQKHTYITWPQLLPTTFFVLVISIVNSFKVFKETYLLYGQYPQNSVYFIQHYMNNHFIKLNYERITTCSIIFAVFILLIVFVLYKAENKFSKGVWS